MAGKVLIGGTAYTITGGKTLVGGTAYSISGGKTLIGGTAYDIVFQQGQHTLVDMLSHTVVVNIAGCDSSTQQYVTITVSADGTYYLFVFEAAHIAVYKIVRAGTITKTQLCRTSATYGDVTIQDSSTIKTSLNMFGATMALCQFSGYQPAEIDALLLAATITSCAGRNNKGSGSVATGWSNFNEKIMLVARNTDIAFSFVRGRVDPTEVTVLFGTNAANPSLVLYSYPSFAVSTDGTTVATQRGASMLSMI